jgi:hypothetical protein
VTDIPRLRKIIDYVLSLPDFRNMSLSAYCDAADNRQDVWYQCEWVRDDRRITEAGVVSAHGHSCGTAACVAGHAVLMFGETGVSLDHSYGRVVFPDGRLARISEYAGELLGLSAGQQRELFAGHNDADDLRSILERIESGNL